MKVANRVALIIGAVAPLVAAVQEVDKKEPCSPIDRAGYEIKQPGRYCVTRDLHTRLDFADHSAERALVEIKSSNVVLDLRGHRLGRGWLFVQHGGTGITIAPRVYVEVGRVVEDDRMENIVIRNGVLTDFSAGIYLYREHQFLNRPILPRRLTLIGPGIFSYETSNIRVENVVCERCDESFSFSDWASSREEFLRERDVKPSNFRPR